VQRIKQTDVLQSRRKIDHRNDHDMEKECVSGLLRVETTTAVVRAGKTIITSRGERIRYSSHGPDGAEYITVCLPAFSPGTVDA
jgi:hypothetical protein